MKINWIHALILAALILAGFALFRGNYEARIRKFQAEEVEFQEMINQMDQKLAENESKLIALDRQYRGLEQINEGLEAEIARLPRVIVRTQEIPVIPEIVDGNLPDQMLNHFDELTDQGPETLPKYIFPSKEYGENLFALLWYAYQQERTHSGRFRTLARDQFKLYESRMSELEKRNHDLVKSLVKLARTKTSHLVLGPGIQIGSIGPDGLKSDFSFGFQITWVWIRIR